LTELAQTINGIKTLPSGTVFGTTSATVGLTLNNSTASYTPTVLNYYEEYSGTIQFTMSGNNISVTCTLRIIRIGKQVTLSLSNMDNFTTSGASAVIIYSAIPTRFRPVHVITNPCMVYTSAARQCGLFRLTTNGIITIYPLLTNLATGWGVGADNWYEHPGLSYCIN